MELIRQHATSRTELIRFIEDMLAQKLSLTAGGLERLNALAKQLEELLQDGDATDIFHTLGELFERLDESESALRGVMDDHNSDFDAHINDRDRETLDNVEEYREAVERLFNQTEGSFNALQSRIDDNREVLGNQMQALTRHLTDSAVHFDNTEQKNSALAMKIIEFTDGREFPLIFSSAETGLNSNRINVHVEELTDGSYISRNDTVVVSDDGTVQIQAIQPFDGRIMITTDFKTFWGGKAK